MKKALLSICLVFNSAAFAANPVFPEVFTADPAAIVHQDTVYLYTGHDVAKDNKTFFEMHDWLVFSSKDMLNWTEHGSKLAVKDFSWAKGDAWASHVIEKKVSSIGMLQQDTPRLMALRLVWPLQTVH